MRKKAAVLVLLVLLIAAAVAGWKIVGNAKSKQERDLRLFGDVDIREVALGFRVAGRVAEVLRDEGDAVHAGDVVARLDDDPNRREMAEANARVGSSRARLQLLQAGYRPQEIAQARAALRERETTLANDERLFRRQQELFESHTVSPQERDDARARFEESQARVQSAREQLSLLDAGYRKEDIAQAESDLAAAEATLASAELRLADTVLKAPSDGVVITRAHEPGAILQAGATVLTVSLREPVWVRAYVREAELGEVHPGQSAEIYTDTHPDRPFKGQVGFISPKAEFTPRNVETPELRTSLVYRLRIVVAHPDDALRQGMPVTVRLARQEAP
jgi:HlyD family secretion protein